MRPRRLVTLLPLPFLVMLGLTGCFAATATEPIATEPRPAAPVEAAEAAITWPAKCSDGPRVLCADQDNNKVAYFRDGVLVHQLDARFGPSGTPGVSPTRNGEWKIFRKVADDWSAMYQQPMIHALYFSGGEAVHYSPDFAAVGYADSSHGCINIRDEAAMQSIFGEVQVGDPVHVWGTPPPPAG